MNDFLEKLAEYMSATEGLLKEYGPQAADLALWLVQAQAVFSLVSSLAILTVAAVALRQWGIPTAKNARDEKYSLHDMKKEGAVLCALAINIPIGVTVLICFEYLLTFYYWLAAFSPVAGLAYKAMQASGLI